jgi:ABC-2 type transport system permease protein
VIASIPIVGVTLRALVDRRRTWLMLLVASLPILLTIVIRVAGGRPGAPQILDTLMIRTVMPLVALVFGTAALGSELEDGTAVYLITKPVARWRIVLAKGVVAAGLTMLVVVPVTVAAVFLRGSPAAESVAIGYGIAVALGATAYAVVFLALSVFTSRALVLGLVYVLVWEGILAGLLEGVRFLSIRQATLGVAASVSGVDPGQDPMDLTTSLVILLGAIGGALLLASWRLTRYQVRSAD